METISFFINGNLYEVKTNEIAPEYRLVDFIRNEAHLTGTKITCREGGCGACVVSVKSLSSVTNGQTVKAVNSCLVPVLSCNGWNIATVEGIGNKKEGLHPIQKRIVEFSASQCGFCTPGMVMSMYSLMDNKKQKVLSADVDAILDGNICRCTGYRPILDAFKSLSSDASEEIKSRCSDIEDSRTYKCTFNCGACKATCNKPISNDTVTLKFSNGEKWVEPSSVAQVLETLKKFQETQTKYRLVAGNTGTGVYKHDGPYEAYVDLGCVVELKKWSHDSTGITIGSGVTISETIEILNLEEIRQILPFSGKVTEHLWRIANVPVRNRATLAGNLMLKHAHKEFPSDIFILLESLGAKIRIASADDTPKMYTMLEFLNIDMFGKLILSIYIPQRKNGYFFTSFKITRRFQNAHAYVNAAFLFKLDQEESKISVAERPRILFCGINHTFAHASLTEVFLANGHNLLNPKVLEEAMKILDNEIRPDLNEIDGSVQYRSLLPKSLFYKLYLEILGQAIPDKLKSGAWKIPRNLSTGKPRYETENKENELYGPAHKLEAPAQATGQAEYLNDIPKQHNELFGVFVLSSVANAKIKSIDSREALRIPGVVEFVSAMDIPGNNNALPYGFFPVQTLEKIFIDKEVNYAGQPVGIILAETRLAAIAGMRRVRIEYEHKEKPILCIEDALQRAEEQGVRDSLIYGTIPSVSQEGSEVVCTNQVKGQFKIGGQAHFHMEQQGCLCIPMEDGMTIYCGTQWIDHTVNTVAGALGVTSNAINMVVRRIGGSFGARITRASGLIAAGAVAANKVNRPVRVILDLEANMEMIGKRPAYLTSYEVGFDDEGRIGSLKTEVLCDLGFCTNEPENWILVNFIQNVYKVTNWEVKIGGVTTHTHTNTTVRAPASPSAVAIIEYIMEHISHALKKDPLEVRLANIAQPTDFVFPTNTPFSEDILIVRLIEELRKSSNYDQRKKEVEAFNAANRWKKRGIALIPVRFHAEFHGLTFPVYVTINHFDGTVSVSHGGIEIGQGINTKVAQTVAFALKLPLEKVKVKPTDNLIGNNSSLTGAAITSESCCEGSNKSLECIMYPGSTDSRVVSLGALRACNILNERLEAVKNTMENKSPTWEEVVAALHAAKQSLSAMHMFGPLDGKEGYNVWLANATEVEVDVLTGEYKVARVDLLEDTGKCISPAVDLGQIEGAFMMGHGLWTTEKLMHDKDTGKLLTNNTWTYKVPETKDLPEDFRVTLFSSVPNAKGILGTKATGEPPILASVCVVFALKNAIDSARADAGNFDWYQIDGPVTPQDVVKYALTSSNQFKILD